MKKKKRVIILLFCMFLVSCGSTELKEFHCGVQMICDDSGENCIFY